MDQKTVNRIRDVYAENMNKFVQVGQGTAATGEEAVWKGVATLYYRLNLKKVFYLAGTVRAYGYLFILLPRDYHASGPSNKKEMSIYNNMKLILWTLPYYTYIYVRNTVVQD